MYYVMFCQEKEVIFEQIDLVMDKLVDGWLRDSTVSGVDMKWKLLWILRQYWSKKLFR